MRASTRRVRLRNQALGLVFIVLLGLMGWLAVRIYDKAFSDAVPVTLHADRAGTQLKINADVKVKGVPVGSVRDIRVRQRGDGVDVELAMFPGMLNRLPHNVTARLLPKTLFGQRYVSIVLPDQPERRALAKGDEIMQDKSIEATELDQALRDLMPVLQAVQPQKLSITLGAISQALERRGKPLGETMVLLKRYLAELDPTMPALQEDITKFADTVALYERAGPDIIDALSGFTTTTETLAEQRQGLSELFTTLTTASDDLDSFLRANKDTIIKLSATAEPTLRLLAKYSPEFPCLAEAASQLVPRLDKALGAGTNEPGLHVHVKIKPSRGKHTGSLPVPAGVPHCPAAGGVVPAANSPGENRLIAELLAAGQGTDPSAAPGWGSLLIGPLLRGTEVTVE